MFGHILRVLLVVLALIVIIIGICLVAFGANPTVQFMAQIAQFIAGTLPPVTDLNTISIDNELRFFGVLFCALGVYMAHTAFTLKENLKRIPFLCALFFFGGLARMYSHVQVGEPHHLFVMLMWIELGMPIVVFFLYSQMPKPAYRF